MKFFLVFIFVAQNIFAQSHTGFEESTLLKSCAKQDVVACEKLGAYYINKENWDKAIVLGEAMCAKELPLGCTYAGTAMLAKGKPKEGNQLLTKACDKFEPFACRSLGRLMKSGGEDDLSHLYFRRACHYGLKEICSDLNKKKVIFSKDGLDFIKKVQEDCRDSQSSACSDRLHAVENCFKPLSKQDCLLLPGHLSIFFRAKLMESEAKFSLTTLVAAQKKLKDDPKVKRYSYDLARVLKDFKPQNNYRYVFGFMKACSGHAKGTSRELFPQSYQNLDSRMTGSIRSYFLKGKSKDCYDLSGGFEAYAVGILDPLHPTKVDVWKINHDGNLIQVEDGLPTP